ncbi:MAG: ECF-type sigma factor [Acidobacteriota bacterium]|nr:ECF-type sigma factor [Acidobacteriota bacterium]
MAVLSIESFRGLARDDAHGSEPVVHELGPFLRRAVRRELARGGKAVPEEVDDLVQEAWCRLLDVGRRRIRAFRGESPGELALYLAALVRTVVADHRRAAASAKRGGGRRPLALTGEGGAEVIPLRDPEPTAEARLLAREQRREARLRLRELAGPRATPRRLRLLELALTSDLPSSELARRLAPELTPSSIDSMVCRFRSRLAARGIALPSRRRGRRGRHGERG